MAGFSFLHHNFSSEHKTKLTESELNKTLWAMTQRKIDFFMRLFTER